MGKRLLSKDYDEIVFETFKLPESDFFKYYSNIVEEHIPFNSDLYEELILSVNRWIVWYRSQHQEDYTFGGRTWDGDKLMNPDETSISLLSLFDIRRHIDKSFFDMQLEQIEILKVRNDIDKLTEANEKFKLQLHQLEKKPIKNGNQALSEIKDYPSLPDCFIDKNYFLNTVLKNTLVSDMYTLNEDGSYILKRNKKSLLAGLAHRLFDTNKLNGEIIKTNQDLARVFCPYFNVKYNPKEEKQFQPDRAKIEYFNFIK